MALNNPDEIKWSNYTNENSDCLKLMCIGLKLKDIIRHFIEYTIQIYMSEQENPNCISGIKSSNVVIFLCLKK